MLQLEQHIALQVTPLSHIRKSDVSVVCRALGRRRTMTIGGALFIIGAALQAGAMHLAMLIVGRVMLGFGVGLANQVGI